jgi:hypothetical protein
VQHNVADNFSGWVGSWSHGPICTRHMRHPCCILYYLNRRDVSVTCCNRLMLSRFQYQSSSQRTLPSGVPDVSSPVISGLLSSSIDPGCESTRRHKEGRNATLSFDDAPGRLHVGTILALDTQLRWITKHYRKAADSIRGREADES